MISRADAIDPNQMQIVTRMNKKLRALPGKHVIGIAVREHMRVKQERRQNRQDGNLHREDHEVARVAKDEPTVAANQNRKLRDERARRGARDCQRPLPERCPTRRAILHKTRMPAFGSLSLQHFV